MKKFCVITILLGVYCIGWYALLRSDTAFAQETLKITRDQFEFRDAPQANEDTLIGTLRIGTSVEWTGKTSGRWFEIKAPNGQTGWVHDSGLSRPKTRVMPTPEPRKAPQAETSRSTSSTQNQPTLSELEKTNEQYKAQLEEKDQRITELSTELGALEDKLTDVGQMVEDHKQLLKLEELKGADAQNEIAALQETLKEKDENALAQKVEITKLQSQLKEFSSQQTGFSLERIILIISLLLNLLGLFLLGYIKTRRPSRDQSEYDDHSMDEAQPVNANDIAKTRLHDVPASDAVNIQITHETDPHLQELDVVMEAPEQESVPAEVIEEDQNYVEEDVVIDLEDVLPETQTGPMSSAPVESVESDEIIITEEPLQKKPDEVITIEEPLQQAQAIEEQQSDVVEAPVSPVEAPQPSESEEPELAQSEEPVQALSEELEAELDLEPEEFEEPVEELVEPSPALEQDAILEDDELEELETTPKKQEVEVGGDTFEVLPKRNTQLIESEDESEHDFATETATTASEYPEEEDEEDMFMNPGMIEDIEEDMAVQNNVASASRGSEEFESSLERVTQNFEPGDDIASTPIETDVLEEVIEEEELEEDIEEEIFEEDIVELEEDGLEEIQEEDMLKESPSATEHAAPSLLEPSPFVIEPEYEPEEQPEEPDVKPEQPAEPKYDIELVKVGNNPEHVLHILSKIEGLTKSPQELVKSAPCIIARGANKVDAENFQLVMKKFGSDVRLVER